MKQKRGHFWFSLKQREVNKKLKSSPTLCALDGFPYPMEFTQATHAKDDPSFWDDMIYLGEGVTCIDAT